MQHLKPGTLLQKGKYRVISVLGQGGFGLTYLGEHVMLGRKVAIKEYFPKQYCDRDSDTSHVTANSTASAEVMERYRSKFIKEAVMLSRFVHPNIVSIQDVFEENNTAYYVMEYVDGPSLSDMLVERKLPTSEALVYINKVGQALMYIHERKINHLDVKPANIMIRKKDNEPILIDFGLSKHYDRSGNETSTTPLGISKGYAPVEQYAGSITSFSPESDVYSLGATLYKTITGTTPPEPSVLLNGGELEFPSFVPDHIATVVRKAMSLAKAQRYKSIAEFLEALNCGQADEAEVAQKYDEGAPEGGDERTEILMSGNETQITGKETNGETIISGGGDAGGNGGEGIDIPGRPDSTDSEEESPEKKAPKKKSKWVLICVILFAVGLLAGLLAIHFMNSGDSADENNTADSMRPATIAADTSMVERMNMTVDSLTFVYTGSVNMDGIPHGTGKAWYKGSIWTRYEGHFYEGEWDGHGELLYRNGDQFIGDFDRGSFAKGVYLIGEDGSYYKGDFKNEMPYNGSWRKSNKELIDSVRNGKSLGKIK